MTHFATTRPRDAWATIRGYVYQVDLTLRRWLSLGEGQVLQLERGEDIDIVGQQMAQALAAEPQELTRVLEQVKHRDSTITLRDPAAIAAIASFIEHRNSNPGIDLLFRFTTNARVGRERQTPIPGGTPGITAWKSICSGELESEARIETLHGIRAILAAASQPPELSDDTWNAYTRFQSVDDSEFVDLIERFEWSTQAGEAALLRNEIQAVLLAKGLARNEQEASGIYHRLFFYVLRILSSRDLKELSIADLKAQLGEAAVSVAEQEFLNNLGIALQLLEGRVASLERFADQQSLLNLEQARFNAEHLETNIGVAAQLQQFANRLGMGASVDYLVSAVSLDIPPQGPRISPRNQTVTRFGALVAGHVWTYLEGSTGSGKTQLAALIAHAWPHARYWAGFRDYDIEQSCLRLDALCTALVGHRGPTPRTAWYGELCRHLGDSALLVLDDLPRLTGTDEFSQRLLQLVSACATYNVKLLTTSTFPLPSRIRNTFDDASLLTQGVPLFNNEEARELLLAYGATPPTLTDPFVVFVNAIAKQYPLTLAAIASYLQRHGWTPDSEALEGLRNNEYASELNSETIHQLLETIEDSDTRELLYRLGLSLGPFSREDARAVADVPEPVRRVNEHLDALIGPWVRYETTETFTISPLISSLRGADLDRSTYHDCHVVYGDRIIRRGTIGPLEAHNAFIHYVSAEEHTKAALVMLLVLSKMSQIEREVPDYGFLSIWAEQPLPESIDLGMRVFLRAYQIQVRSHRRMDTSYLVEDLDSLIAQTTEEHTWAVYSALVILPVTPGSPVDPGRLITYLVKVTNSLPDASVPGGGKLTSVIPYRPERLIWWEVSNISNAGQLLKWLSAFERFTPEQRENAFSDDLAAEAAPIAVDRVWHVEADKPGDQRNWQGVLDTLTEFENRARAINAHLLWGAAIRAKVVVLAEYLNDLDGARAVAEAAWNEAPSDPTVRFLIAEMPGKEVGMPRQEALTWLERAVNQETSALPFYRTLTLLQMSKVKGEQDPDAAIEWARRAVELGGVSEFVPELQLVKALGELGLAYFLAGDNSAAYAAVDEAALRLLDTREDTQEWKGVFAAFAYVTSYVTSIVTTGLPPQVDSSNAAYTPPRRGVFLTDTRLGASDYDAADMDKRVPHIITQLALLAGETGNDERAAYWMGRGQEAARNLGRPTAIAALAPYAITFLLLADKYEEAVSTGLEGGVMLTAIDIARKNNTPSQTADIDVDDLEAVLGPKPGDAWKRAEREGAFAGLLLAILRLNSVVLNDPEKALAGAVEVAGVCKEIASSAVDPPFWYKAAELIEVIYARNVTLDDLLERLKDFDQGENNVLYTIAYLGAMIQPSCLAAGALQVFRAVLPIVSQFSMAKLLFRRIVLPFFVDYWRSTFNRQRFRFRAPGQIESDLSQIEEVPVEEKLTRLLRIIEFGMS